MAAAKIDLPGDEETAGLVRKEGGKDLAIYLDVNSDQGNCYAKEGAHRPRGGARALANRYAAFRPVWSMPFLIFLVRGWTVFARGGLRGPAPSRMTLAKKPMARPIP
jgi:hypothetical protein